MHKFRGPIIAAVVTLLILCLVSTSLHASRNEDGVLKVTFFDVGQGDATFIESPSGTQVLIDGGKGRAVLGGLGKELGFFDRTLDMVIATHPDLDHIGGLIDVLDQYSVATIVLTENESDTPEYEVFLERVAREGATVLYARRGQVYDLGRGESGSTTLTILFPDRDPKSLESNFSSIVSKLTYGASTYLFMADSPKEIETYLVGLNATEVVSDVLKVGHHGSRTSTDESFVRAVSPAYAIISSGKDNTYGHPHREVTDVLSRLVSTQKNTAEFGSIFSATDGQTIWFK